ncbi:hypothetical protein HgNV_059 [Homarus gammarus nudivirus]|uniref:Uncharacterized protein n=1 Tax=Homarus gammarus nudivirus TaxID=2509616 RepID=A0A411HBA5_9VIRU|nr:hypothetical protein KM727_gp59 [Homarus gammarus nudivirus]QBB28664.1 hypothetical protein HgNV_059 [Homarus gammarus nudivirus]
MPKRKITPQYADKDDAAKKPSTTTKVYDISNITDKIVNDSGNSTDIGLLYTNALNDSNTTEQKYTVYMGKVRYNIITRYTPLEIFNTYYNSVINGVCGYIEHENINIHQLKVDPVHILSQTFLYCLYYNNIIIPNKIILHKHETNVLLGESIYFNKSYEKNELKIHISKPIVLNYLNNEDVYDVTFSSRINNETCSIKETLESFREGFNITTDIYNTLTKLFVLADHAATHYIEEYITDSTDWIHHINFGKSINAFTLINTIFKISANISNATNIPKLQIDNKKGPNLNGIVEIDRLFPATNTGAMFIPIDSVNEIPYTLNSY